MSELRTRIKRNRRTHIELLFDACCAAPNHRPTRAELRNRMPPHLSEARFEEVLQEALDSSEFPLKVASGGKYMRFTGSERPGGAGRVGLYSDVGRKLECVWGPRRGMRFIKVFDTARSGRRDGSKWVHPDLVIQAHPRRKASANAMPLLHSFEIECAGAFDIASIYQAHAQGRGADYSWVAFQDVVDRLDRDRIEKTAWELGIGLIAFTNPNNLSTWTTIDAALRKPTPAERTIFQDRVLPKLNSATMPSAASRPYVLPGSLTANKVTKRATVSASRRSG